MVFSSSIFLLYFLPLALLTYYLINPKYRNITIVIFSLFFYAWGAPKYVFVVLFAMFADFYFARFIHEATGKKKKIILAVALSLNIGFLLFFKYANFFVDNVNDTLVNLGFQPFEFMRIALPIGISFFTFHEMSYLIDVYRAEKLPLRKITDYAVYILFFPQLIAGPIIRFNEIADQIQSRSENENIDNRLTGFYRFVIGLSKKVLVANVLGEVADKVFSMPVTDMATSTAWIGVVAYTFQIYFDFSGYSDMAIGMARMMGFKFPENFNNPYISQSITELWRRWHMTLSRWMRDYLYISLGGNKVKSKVRMYFNLSIVFIISGFWHGAAWNFVVWGAFHGFFLILDRLFLLKFLGKAGKWPSVIFTFLITMIGWVFFRSESLGQAAGILKKMFWVNMQDIQLHLSTEFITILSMAALISFSNALTAGVTIEKFVYSVKHGLKGNLTMSVFCLILFLLSLGSIMSSGFNPFIYYRF